MNFLHSPETVLTVLGMLGNLAWTVLNIRMQATFEKRMKDEFCTRTECNLKHELVKTEHRELADRLTRVGA